MTAIGRRAAAAASVAAVVFSLNLALASDAAPGRAPGIVIFAQRSTAGSESLTTPPPRPMQQSPVSPSSTSPQLRESLPKTDYTPPTGIVAPPRNASDPEKRPPDSSQQVWWGAVGFTADGSYSTVWKMNTQAEAEAEVAKRCAKFGRGACETVSFSGKQCVGLATFIGRYGRKRWNLSYTAGGETYPDAQRSAMSRCNSDERTRGRCQNRTVACADGR